MTQPLEVLVIESHPGAAAPAVRALEAAGYHVHRCHDDNPGFPWQGVIDPDLCPFARRTDAALLVPPGSHQVPRHSNRAQRCAIRADVPLVEEGPAALDPYEPFLAARDVDRQADRDAGVTAKACRLIGGLVVG